MKTYARGARDSFHNFSSCQKIFVFIRKQENFIKKLKHRKRDGSFSLSQFFPISRRQIDKLSSFSQERMCY